MAIYAHAVEIGMTNILSQAWKRHIDSRNMVLETLANVPLLLASVYNKREPYEEDQGLLALVGDFRTMLLHSLIRLAEIISPSQHGKTQCMFMLLEPFLWTLTKLSSNVLLTLI